MKKFIKTIILTFKYMEDITKFGLALFLYFIIAGLIKVFTDFSFLFICMNLFALLIILFIGFNIIYFFIHIISDFIESYHYAVKDINNKK